MTTVRVGTVADLPTALEPVTRDGPRPVVVLVGGAAAMEDRYLGPVRQALGEWLLPALDRWGAAVVDGGTDAGVMRVVGRLREATGARFPLVGVVADGTVAPQGTGGRSGGAAELEPHHTLVLVVPGRQWGDESGWLGEVARVVAAGRPTLTLMVNGGDVARDDVTRGLAQHRPMVVLAGTGRLADTIAAAAAGEVRPGDRAERIASSPLTRVVDVSDGQALGAVLDELLGGGS